VYRSLIGTSECSYIRPLTAGCALVGSLAGAQEIVLSGSGFDGTNLDKNKVSICGLPCKVTISAWNSVTCKTQAYASEATWKEYPTVQNDVLDMLGKPDLITIVPSWYDSEKVFDGDLVSYLRYAIDGKGLPSSFFCSVCLASANSRGNTVLRVCDDVVKSHATPTKMR
jgi:hypothetical protein